MNRLLPIASAILLTMAIATPAWSADWTTDTAKSSLGFSGTQSGTPFQGHFSRWQAAIAFDPKSPDSGHARVTIETASASTGDKQKDESLPSADWFDSKQFPQAVFEASHFTAKGGNAYEASGTLTIRGIQKAVTLPFTLDIADGVAHAKGNLPIVRTDFGVGQGAWKDGNVVALAVTINLDIVAKTQP